MLKFATRLISYNKLNPYNKLNQELFDYIIEIQFKNTLYGYSRMIKLIAFLLDYYLLDLTK